MRTSPNADAQTSRLLHLAHYDLLTDLPNRAHFRGELERALERVQRGERIAILYIDIDEFKSVNDTLGHAVGDELLKVVGDRLRGCVGKNDMVARLGGDEFAVIQSDVRAPTDVSELLKRIYERIRAPLECGGHLLTTDASIGVALAPDDGTDLNELLKNADLAMYGAKADGRRTYRFFEPSMDARVKALRALEVDLRKAIVEGAFEIHYQPLIDLRSRAITGCEALLRWRHPEHGMIEPARFIPVAEDTGLINQLGEWALDAACAEAASWPDHIKIAVNVSPVQFRNQTLALKVAAALAASGLSANRLELEITEAVLIRDDEAALATLHELRRLGVRIALDDFGTQITAGLSSLSYLQRFPFDKIKIDRSFIENIAASEASSSIVRAVVGIGAARNMTTTAEGVETEAQRARSCGEARDLHRDAGLSCSMARRIPAAEIAATASRQGHESPAATPARRRGGRGEGWAMVRPRQSQRAFTPSSERAFGFRVAGARILAGFRCADQRLRLRGLRHHFEQMQSDIAVRGDGRAIEDRASHAGQLEAAIIGGSGFVSPPHQGRRRHDVPGQPPPAVATLAIRRSPPNWGSGSGASSPPV